jgi:hypothetical protein
MDPLAVVGMVRNLKDGKVEIVCKGPDVGLLYETIQDWDEKRTFEIRGHSKEDHYDPEPTLMICLKWFWLCEAQDTDSCSHPRH